MLYTSDLQPAPEHVIEAGHRVPVAVLEIREEWDRLAGHGLYRLIRESGEAPLGHEPSELIDGILQVTRTGTEAEREAAALAQWRESASISRLQARLQLLDAGLWAGVMAWAAAADPAAAAFFEDAQVWRRNDPTLAAAAAQLGLSDSDLDDLFRAAALR
jgi:hypothetical protein